MRLSSVIVICSALVTGTMSAQAAGYPDHPVHLIVGFSPGGGSDILTRLVGNALSQQWGQPVLIENRPGANGNIAADHVAHSAPDGCTLIMVTNSHVTPTQGAQPNFDPVKSFAPVSLVDTKPMVLIAKPSFPANSIKELMAMAKADPGKLNYGSDGPASNPSLIMRAFLRQTGLKMTEVAYKGGGDAQVAVLSGEIQLTFGTLSAALDEIKTGQLKALALSSDVRSPGLPDVPTLAEAGNLPGFNEGVWNGILAPAGTPREVVDKIYRDVVEITKKPELLQTFTQQGIVPIASTPAAFTSYLSSEIEKMAVLAKTPEAK